MSLVGQLGPLITRVGAEFKSVRSAMTRISSTSTPDGTTAGAMWWNPATRQLWVNDGTGWVSLIQPTLSGSGSFTFPAHSLTATALVGFGGYTFNVAPVGLVTVNYTGTNQFFVNAVSETQTGFTIRSTITGSAPALSYSIPFTWSVAPATYY